MRGEAAGARVFGEEIGLGFAAGWGNFGGEIAEPGVEGGLRGGEKVENRESESAGAGAGFDDGEFGRFAAELPHFEKLAGDEAAEDG